MSISELLGYVSRGFADDLNEMKEREAKVLVPVTRLAREAPSLPDGLPRHGE